MLGAMRIDLNADLGEGVGDDDALLAIVTSANIATGAHAGGGAVLRRAVALAVQREVAIGAHPSYRDRAGFGRDSHLDVLHRDASARSHLVADLVEQVLLVAREAESHGAALAHVKAHGSLYNEAVADLVAAQIVTDAVLGAERVLGYPVAVLTQPGGALDHTASGRGLVVIAEGFADRAYHRTGQLVPRAEPGAVHAGTEAMVAQALALAAGHVDSVDGQRIAVSVGSLCVHGDTPLAVAASTAIRAALESRGWQVAAPGAIRRAGGASEVGAAPRAGRSAGSNGRTVGVAVVGGEPDVVIHPFGDRALLVEPPPGSRPGTEWVLNLADRARRQWPRASVVPGLASVLVVYAQPSDRPGTREVLAALVHVADPFPSEGAEHRPHSHVIRTRYDGPDLAEVAWMLGLPSAEVVARHAAAVWTVAAIGFSPGFGYLTSDDPLFAGVGRRADPRERVPRGSVALAAGMCAIYPSPTPGGWQLIGSTTAELFDVEAEHPALLRVGDGIRFLEAP